jgi:hypothetical protein
MPRHLREDGELVVGLLKGPKREIFLMSEAPLSTSIQFYIGSISPPNDFVDNILGPYGRPSVGA